MEVAGVVLGTVPIFVIALESYAKLYRLLTRYKRCRDGAQELLECLEIQETIFRNETELLYSPIVGASNSRHMVHDRDHPLWSDCRIELDAVLGESKGPLLRAASRVFENTRAFHAELVDLAPDDTPGSTADTKESRRSLRRKFKYTFSEKKLTTLATNIRKATKDYRVLRAQIQNLSRTRPNRKVDSDDRSVEHSERVRITRAAAKRIYEALSKACTLHIQHQAHVSLMPSYGLINAPQEIKFKMAFHQGQQSQKPELHETLWFVVETLTNNPIPRQPSSQPQANSKRRPSLVLETLQDASRGLSKRVRFDLAAPAIRVACPSSLSTQLLPKELPDLTLHHNFCTHLRTNCDPKNCQDGLCIGLLENSEEWRLPVYSSIGPAVSCTSKYPEFDSLLALLTRPLQQPSKLDRIPLVQRLQYAKLLSQAVLNFFATPWMQSPWSSKDIIIYNAKQTPRPSLEDTEEAELFVDVPVRDLKSRDPEQPDDTFDPPFIQNIVLYNLGVVLLELADEQPVQRMRIESDNIPGMPPSMADHFAAFRQAKEISSCMGPKYSEIVRKCLHCDFGYGWDLQNPALQDAVHLEVVSELDRLETGLRSLQIG